MDEPAALIPGIQRRDLLRWAGLTGLGSSTPLTDAAHAADAASGAVGDQYTALCALALRQAVAGTELVNHNGSPWTMPKEISSNGDFSTVDVIYPAFPAYLTLSPHYLELVLAVIFGYVENHGYPKTWAPHDLGVYPDAFGRINQDEEDMPIEESANMLIMVAAITARMPAARATTYSQQHYPLLRQWAEYLVANLPDAGNQNQTDDFTGWIAHSVNLALKGIVGIGATAEIARAAGNTADASGYAAKARSYTTATPTGCWTRTSSGRRSRRRRPPGTSRTSTPTVFRPTRATSTPRPAGCRSPTGTTPTAATRPASPTARSSAVCAGKLGGAVLLNGTGAVVTTARPVVRTDNSFTVTAWVRLDDTGAYHTAVSQDGASASGFYLQYTGRANRWAFAMTAADTDDAATTVALSSAAPAVGGHSDVRALI